MFSHTSTPSTWKGRTLAIAAGTAFAAGGLTILLDKDLLKPLEWCSAQWLTILTIGGTITAGHLMVEAWRAKGWLSAIGFFVLFVAGTMLVVYSSVGRQVETGSIASMSAEDTNARLADKRADLAAAKDRLAYANERVDALSAVKPCSSVKACRDWKTNAKDVTAAIKGLESDIDALGPRKVVNAQAEAMAEIAMLMHVPGTKAQIVAFLLLLVPFLKTMFFEIGSIVSFGFALRPSRRRPVSKFRESYDRSARSVDGSAPAVVMPTLPMPAGDDAGQSDFPTLTAERFDELKAALVPSTAEIVAFPTPNGSPNGSPNGPKPGSRARQQAKEAALVDLRGRLDRGERFGSQVELAERYDVATSTMSEWLGEWERFGLIPARMTVGRCKAVAAG